MLERLGIIAGLICLSSGILAVDPAQPVTEDEVIRSAAEIWRERRLEVGEQVYRRACAACHDQGLNGAPAIGDRQAWLDRSPMWSAVLFEHARNGYLEMPARGSHEDLTDQQVDAAAEYLLSKTFPEMPLD
jgi:cytochrome c5